MTYLKIPHQSAKDILSCYEASDEILELVEQYIEPAALIDAAIKAEFFSDTAIFIAHALPVREAVWWACCCADQRNDWSLDEANAIRAAKAWVHTPDETSRRFAEQMAELAQLQTGAGWGSPGCFLERRKYDCGGRACCTAAGIFIFPRCSRRGKSMCCLA